MKIWNKVWNVGGEPFTDVDDAVEAVAGLVGNREMAIYKTNHDDWKEMVYKEIRADLMRMDEGDIHNFMGVPITLANMSFEFELPETYGAALTDKGDFM